MIRQSAQRRQQPTRHRRLSWRAALLLTLVACCLPSLAAAANRTYTIDTDPVRLGADAMVDGNLVRTNAPSGGVPTETRVLLRGVIGWRWRVDDGTAVRLELKAFTNPDAHHNLTGAASYRIDRRTEKLTLALRGRPGGARW